MDKNNCSRDLSPDALVEILVRLSPNTRRRLRLVSRLWRKLIDKRTATDMQKRTKIIAVNGKGYACVVDLLAPGSNTSLWPQEQTKTHNMVGTCNGLVCLWDDFTAGGTVANPSTGEVLRLPRLPMPRTGITNILLHRHNFWGLHQTYCFAYHPMTRRYKVVNVPCRHFSKAWDKVHVFTLGAESWREVHVGTDARCSFGSSLVDVDGMVYWLTEDARNIMAFDLQHDRVTRTEPPPVQEKSSTCRLTKVHGSLGLAVGDDFSVTVWVLDGVRWIRRYFLDANNMRHSYNMLRTRVVPVPHFFHGEYFLTLGYSGEVLYRHKMIKVMKSQDVVMQKKHKDRGEAVIHLPHSIYRMFPYVETNEPLSVYNVGCVGA